MKRIMEVKFKMSLENIYSNPFSDYNANTMDSQKIMNFWESPFEKYLVGISEEEIARENTAIVFTGGRGTGKTMLLKHFAITSQIVRAKKENKEFEEVLNEKGYVGIYLRFDTPLLIGFEGLELSQEMWNVIFTHFFEMTICKSFLDALIKLIEEKLISEEEESKLVEEIAKIVGRDKIQNILELSDLLGEDINYVNEYKSEVLFGDIEFKPYKLYTFGTLSFKIADIIKSICQKLENVNFLLLLDEYENFLAFEQKIVNSAIKFSKNIAFRVGMRPMGFHTFDTVSENEFIKEHRDYRNVTFENPLIGKDDTGYLDFLLRIAEKRLRNVEFFCNNNMVDLRKFLGDRENIEEEAKQIVKGKDKHIVEYLKEIRKTYAKKKKKFVITDEQLNKLRCPENPLYEMQNMRMLLKPFDIEFVLKAFSDYVNGIESEESHKYKNDYANKYKLSYLFVLRSIYKVESKQYYGFNDFAYLSSGIVGTFLELCRCTFQYAYFTDKEALFKGEISPAIQTRAALDVAYSEFEQIQRISKYGNYVHQFTKNMGKRFSKYHVDKRISYPETNQFCLDSKELKEDSIEDNVLRAAIMWSVVQKKKGMQQASIGKDDEEIYILNRIFSPVFQISVRTRGGFNVEIDEKEFSELIQKEEEIVIIEEDNNDDNKQMSIFDFEWGDTDD